MPVEKLLSVRNLTTKIVVEGRAIPVVNNLSFEIEAGETLALVGESGCGKSMTALSLLRILPEPPALLPEGRVDYRGCNLLELSEREMRKIRGRSIAMIFQDPMSALNPLFPIGDQLMEVVDLHLNLSRNEGLAKIEALLEEVGIENPPRCMKSYPHELSGGIKQRVMIGMALLCEPDLLIADEPTTALDVTIQAQVLKLLRDLQQKRGMAILLITHDMGVVAEMAHHVVVMYATRAVEKGRVADLFASPSHPYTQGLFASLPQAVRAGERLVAIRGQVPPVSSLPSGCYFHPRCPNAMDECRQAEPPFFSAKGEGHCSACWLYK